MTEIRGEFTLFDDACTREKRTMLTKWEVAVDDGRNTNMITDDPMLEGFLEWGKTYEIIVREITPAKAE